MAKHKVQSPLDHDKVRYDVGDTVDLSEKESAPLLASGAVVKTSEPAEPAKQAKPGLPKSVT